MTDPCPECAKRSYLCFEHHQQLVEDEETLRIFAERWDARLARERAFAEKLARDAFFLGRKVAKGEMLLTRAQEILKGKAETLDETIPIFAYILPPESTAKIVATGFTEGHASVKRSA